MALAELKETQEFFHPWCSLFMKHGSDYKKKWEPNTV